MKKSSRFIQALAAANLLISANGALAQESSRPSTDDSLVVVEPIDQPGTDHANGGCTSNSGCGNSGCNKK